MGVKDFCVYWFRRAQDHLAVGQRAGLVGTNSVSQNRARSASLEYITSGGIITDAVSSQKWPGEAKVHVSLVNWVKGADEIGELRVLDGVEVEHIDAALHSAGAGDWQPRTLTANAGRCFQGPIPVGAGFILTEDEAQTLLAREDADYREVVRPYLVGEDITESIRQQARRWIIDFESRGLEFANRYPEAIAILRLRVKPERDSNARTVRRERWWLLGERAVGMRTAIRPLRRYAASNRMGKRLLLAWQSPYTLPSDQAQVFAMDDDFSLGVLSSSIHLAWAWDRGSTFKRDIRYTPTTVFMTFPWPDPVTGVQREAVAEACRRLMERRSELCEQNQLGLTKLYNAMDDGAFSDLKALHRTLDEAVAACYGWPKAVAQDDAEIVRRLTALNREIAEGGRPYVPFAHLDPASTSSG